MASVSILVERKSRRGELALYVAPRGLDTLMGTLLSNRVIPRLPLAEVALFSLSTGALMYYRYACLVELIKLLAFALPPPSPP